jgi:hypothetical protein
MKSMHLHKASKFVLAPPRNLSLEDEDQDFILYVSFGAGQIFWRTKIFGRRICRPAVREAANDRDPVCREKIVVA